MSNRTYSQSTSLPRYGRINRAVPNLSPLVDPVRRYILDYAAEQEAPVTFDRLAIRHTDWAPMRSGNESRPVPGRPRRLRHMAHSENIGEAVEVLQQLGLKEYEARCFVGLSRLNTGTAKQLSELTEVPRTRVYDAIRVLEAKGLVEIQHSSPRQFRAVPLDEATETWDQYEGRVEATIDARHGRYRGGGRRPPAVQGRWSAPHRDVENRTNDLIGKRVRRSRTRRR